MPDWNQLALAGTEELLTAHVRALIACGALEPGRRVSGPEFEHWLGGSSSVTQPILRAPAAAGPARRDHRTRRHIPAPAEGPLDHNAQWESWLDLLGDEQHEEFVGRASRLAPSHAVDREVRENLRTASLARSVV